MRPVARWCGLGAIFLLGAVAGWAPAPTEGSPLPAATDDAARSAVDMPPIALVLTGPASGQSELRYLRARGPARAPTLELGPVVARVRHLGDGSVRAAVVPASADVAVVAPVTPGRDRSFEGGLFLLTADGGSHLLCRDVVSASAPLPLTDGRVVVARGQAGPWPSEPSELRIDSFALDLVDPVTGSVATLHRYDGYLLHVGGQAEGELVVYRVGPAGADLVAISLTDGAQRPLVTPLLPFARDFSVDPRRGALVLRERDEHDQGLWVVDEVDLATGARSRLFEDRAFALAPHVWPDGAVAVNPARGGLSLLGTDERPNRPPGIGVDGVRAISADDRFVVLQRSAPSKLPVAWLLDRTAAFTAMLPTPRAEAVAVAGFVEPGGLAP